MPKEINYLAFSNEELSTALTEFRRSQANPFPSNRIERLSIRQAQGTFVVTVRLLDRRSGKVIPIEVGPTEVLAAIIFFCKRHRIPLAMRAHKSLDVIGNQIALLTTANFSYSRPEQKDGAIIYTDDDLKASKASLESQ